MVRSPPVERPASQAPTRRASPASPGQPAAGQPGQPGQYPPPGQPGQYPPPRALPAAGTTLLRAHPRAPGPTASHLLDRPPGGSGNNNKVLWIVLGGIAAFMVLAVILVVVLVAVSNNGDDGDAEGTADGTAKSQPAVVKAYLSAVADGDAKKALSLAAVQPLDKDFLTDEVLAESAKTAEITDIRVGDVANEYTSSVPATFKIGDETVTKDFQVTKSGDDWKMAEVGSTIDFTSMRKNTLPMMLNGRTVDVDKVTLFPGTLHAEHRDGQHRLRPDRPVHRQGQRRLPQRQRPDADPDPGGRAGLRERREGLHPGLPAEAGARRRPTVPTRQETAAPTSSTSPASSGRSAAAPTRSPT